MQDLKFLNAFNLIYAVGPATLTLLRKNFGTYENAWRKNSYELRRTGISENIIKEIEIKKSFINPDRELKKLVSLGIWILTDQDPNYPPLLKTINLPPPILYVKGKIGKLENPFAVVGSRKATSYGIRATREFTKELARAGCEIISGLAFGIDTIAHETALEEKAITIAVLGSGIDKETIYPPINRFLAERIIKSGGALISEFPPETPPLKHHFRQRNRIISGMSRGVLVTEAKEKSGALVTANLALEQNREVFALPGSIFSQYSAGPHNLIKDGATIAASCGDILDCLKIEYNEKAGQNFVQGISEKEKNMLNFLDQPLTIDELIIKVKNTPQEIATTLSLLELKGIIKKIGASFVTDEKFRITQKIKKENL